LILPSTENRLFTCRPASVWAYWQAGRRPCRWQFSLPDEQSHLGVRGHRFDEHDVPVIDPHEVRDVPLAAPFHQEVLDFLFIRAGLLLDAEDFPEGQVGRAVILEPAEKDLAIVQEDSLVCGGKLEVAAAIMA